MAVYAIGDVQGCYQALQALLVKLEFDPQQDQLWFSGDLVNRGPQSLEVLLFVMGLGDAAVTVLGNHDLHLLAVAENAERYRRQDTFADVLQAPERDRLLAWLRQQPLMHYDPKLKVSLVHAGLVPQWSVAEALTLAAEVERQLQSNDYHLFFAHMYGNQPDQWSSQLTGWSRLRFITNTFTRLRFCTKKGRLWLAAKGVPGSQPKPYLPWFEVPRRASAGDTILFGHWAALGAGCHGDVYSLDSGCAWGGALTALRVDGERSFVSAPCSVFDAGPSPQPSPFGRGLG